MEARRGRHANASVELGEQSFCARQLYRLHAKPLELSEIRGRVVAPERNEMSCKRGVTQQIHELGGANRLTLKVQQHRIKVDMAQKQSRLSNRGGYIKARRQLFGQADNQVLRQADPKNLLHRGSSQCIATGNIIAPGAESFIDADQYVARRQRARFVVRVWSWIPVAVSGCSNCQVRPLFVVATIRVLNSREQVPTAYNRVPSLSRIRSMQSTANNAVVAWLGVVCATVMAMVVVGGVTRLTGSGLSMVDWQPILGILPPMNEAEWNAAFDAYRQFPEYREINRGMSLEAFKGIFFWEYAHRVLGRLIGVLFFIPLVVFWLSGKIESRYKLPLLGGLILGGLQGLLGWYMVKSGLIDVPRVSHYRLTAHLSLAMFILCYLFWLALSIAEVPRHQVGITLRRVLLAFTVVLVVQIIYGGFTAGMDAGYGYNTWPLMNGQWAADAVFFMEPLWINLLESGATVQFVHRWVAVVVVVLALAVWVLARRECAQIRWGAALLLASVLIQFAIGVLTLIHVVPVSLGTIHQGWATVLLLAVVHLLYASRPSPVRDTVNEGLSRTNQYNAG